MARDDARRRVRTKRVRKVLIAPFCALLVVVIKGLDKRGIAFGPIFSIQFRSTFWEAIRCPKIKDSLAGARWVMAG